MRKALVSSVFLLAFSCLSLSQNFSLNDSVFQVSGCLRTYSIQFDFNKASIRPESYSFLDSVTALFSKKPGLKMEVAVHTDTRTSQSYSIKLSDARARSICNYLVEKGVAKERLIPKGYQGTKPLISDNAISALETMEEKEAAHQKNRRVEFIILST